MIIAVVDSDQRLRLYRAEPGALSELAALKVSTSDPSQLAAIAATLADMAGAVQSNGHKAPRKVARARKPPRPRQIGAASTRGQILRLLSNGELWTTAQLATELAGCPKSTVTSATAQGCMAGLIEKGPVVLSGVRGRDPSTYRITEEGRAWLQAAQV